MPLGGEHPALAWLHNKLGIDTRDTIDHFDTVVAVQIPRFNYFAGPPRSIEPNLQPLAQLPDLRDVRLYGIADRELSPLRGLTQLDTLRISDMPVEDAAPLGDLANLRELSLDMTKISDLSPLHSLDRLERLDIDETPVEDLSPLQGLRNLRSQHLLNIPASDLSPLRELHALESLDLYGTPVSEEQVGLLRTALPNCRINWIP